MWRTTLFGLIGLAGVAGAWASAMDPVRSIATREGPPAASGPSAQELPDRSNPDYVYCEDFEEGRARDGSLPVFNIAKRHGVREGAGYKSRYGFSNVLIEDHGLPPYPRVRFLRHQGVLFVHFHLRSPENFYLGERITATTSTTSRMSAPAVRCWITPPTIRHGSTLNGTPTRSSSLGAPGTMSSDRSRASSPGTAASGIRTS